MKRFLLFSVLGLATLVGAVFAIGALRSPEFGAVASIEISRPPQAVYNFLLNADNLPKWSAEIQKVEKVSDQPLRYKVTSRGESNVMEFYNVQPPREFSSKTEMPSMGVSGVWRIVVEPVSAGSKVTSQVSMRIESAMWRAIAQFMDGNAEEQKTLVDLKKYLEQ